MLEYCNRRIEEFSFIFLHDQFIKAYKYLLVEIQINECNLISFLFKKNKITGYVSNPLSYLHDP